MSTMGSLLNIILILCVCINWVCTEGDQKRQSGEVYSHTIQLSSLFPSSSTCVRSPKASNTNSSMRVVHRYGPCSSLATTSPSHADILRRDQARVNSIHAKLSKKSEDRLMSSQTTDLPAKSGLIIDSESYIVTIGIGTPKQDLSLIFDTGSDLTWIQCEPCFVSCYFQREKRFDPSSSSTYSNVACSSPVCDSFESSGHFSSCTRSNCGYQISYGDESFSAGYLATEKFALTESDVFDDITFGCGENNHGHLNGVAGLLGLGRSSISFPSQTAKTYNNIFSYCLPSSSRYTGHLTFGSAAISSSVQYTPISTSTDNTLYGLDIIGITVGDQKLDIPLTVFSTAGAIIDSGTEITRLPPDAYEELRDAFTDQMSDYTMTYTSGLPFLDTCYDLTGLVSVTIPKISFEFSGGAVVELGSDGVLVPSEDESAVCLAFARNNKDEEPAIFGSVQQKTLQVVYDGVRGRIGFAPNGCS